MTAVLEHATLTAVDDEVRQALKDAADAVENGPARLRAAIIAAAEKGEKPADITRAIGHVYTYDYVARLVRDWRKAHRGTSPES